MKEMIFFIPIDFVKLGIDSVGRFQRTRHPRYSYQCRFTITICGDTICADNANVSARVHSGTDPRSSRLPSQSRVHASHERSFASSFASNCLNVFEISIWSIDPSIDRSMIGTILFFNFYFLFFSFFFVFFFISFSKVIEIVINFSIDY